MAKKWIITAAKDNKYIVQVMRLSDGKRFSLGENTFHGLIKKFWVSKDLKMMASFEEGDATCDVNINDIKEHILDQDPCDESHTDVWARTQAIAFARWTCEGLWSCYGDDWYEYRNEDNPITGEALYNLFIKETENK